MDRIFLDANVLFSAAYRESNGLLMLWRVPHARLLSSRYALLEALNNVEDAGHQRRLEGLAASLELHEAVAMNLTEGIDLPDKDRPILNAAIAASASHLLTGDVHHFGRYFRKRVAGVLVLPPPLYLQSIRLR